MNGEAIPENAVRDEESNYSCPMCGGKLRCEGVTGETYVRGVPVEMDADWLTCTSKDCGWVGDF